MNSIVLISGFIFFIFLSYNESYANDVDDILILENKTMEMIKESKFDSALFYIDEILKINPNNQNALNNKGGVLLNTGNYSEAIQNFDRVLLINENNTEALNNKAIALTFQIQYTEALKLFYKSLKLDSSNETTKNNINNLIQKLYFIDETPNSFGVIITRDQNGQIVTYSKVSEIILQPPLGYEIIREQGGAEEIIIDDEKHEILKFNGVISVNKNQFVGKTDLFLVVDEVQIRVGEIIFNGFIATYGNQIEYNLIILDPPY